MRNKKTKMKTIISPTDFSPISLNAVNYAADLAVAIKAQLILMNIVSLPVSIAAVPMAETTIEELEQGVEQALSNLKQLLLLRTKDNITVHLFSEPGIVENELEEVCRQENPFVVVMSVKHNYALERYFAGSDTLIAISHIPHPVLIIPEIYSFKGIHKIAFACDMESEVSYKTIRIIREWVSFFKASIDIINVTEKENIGSGKLVAPITLQNQLAEFHAAFHFISKEKIEYGINEYIVKNKPDILIVLPKRRGLFEGFFHKSHSRPFIIQPQVPVLAITELYSHIKK
jgi:nucleotide-binding universal stress UspA family protein